MSDPVRLNSEEDIVRWNSDELVKRYAKQFEVDVTSYVNAEEITLQRDEDNGILLFDGCEPGSGEFYEQLAQQPYYYIEDKWEFDEAIDCFPSDSPELSILEIGCGSGAFLERCRDAGFRNAQGIEFNARAMQLCQEKQLSVTDSRIERVAETDQRFDVVCAFQVLEHVPDPVEFIRLASTVLKEGGRLIFSTPNRASFLNRFQWNLLDLPPHHMSRWDEQSYQQTSELLDLTLDEVRTEPLAKYHHTFFANSMVQWLPERSVRKKIAKPLARAAFKLYPFKDSIPGHSMMAVISKHSANIEGQHAVA